MHRVLLLCIAMVLAGCAEPPALPSEPSNEPLTDAPPEQGTAVNEGEDLGTVALGEDGDIGLSAALPDCSAPIVDQSEIRVHPWVIEPVDENGVPWKAESLTIRMTKSADSVAPDITMALLDEQGGELARNTAGPGATELELRANDVPPGHLTVEVRGCAVLTADYTLMGNANMIAAQTFRGFPLAYDDAFGYDIPRSSGFRVEQVTTPEGDTRWHASRVDVIEVSMDVTVGAATIAVERGDVTLTGTKDPIYRMSATLSAVADTEQEARDALAQMLIRHDLRNNLSAHLNLDGSPGGDGWDNRRIDVDLRVPKAVLWKPLTIQGGHVDVNGAKNDALTIEATGSVNIKGSRSTDLHVRAAQDITANMPTPNAGGAWSIATTQGDIELKAREHNKVGYLMSAMTENGTISWSFNDIEAPEPCEQTPCSQTGQTEDYVGRERQVTVHVETGRGDIELKR